ncbi:MAG: DUF61 family protein [Candidatus Bathyarchaeia archaeon]|nr:DUF61 family protein [Candidatus Bathyarchaeota archaeon]
MAESHLEKSFRSILREEVRRLNQHLPKRRKSLRDLIAEDEPSVEAIDGTLIVMSKDELLRLAGIVPENLHDKIQLPIVVQRRFDLGRSIYTVLGGKLEEFTLKYALGLADGDFKDYEAEGKFYIYKPYLSELIRMFHSLIVIGFGMPEGLSEALK